MTGSPRARSPAQIATQIATQIAAPIGAHETRRLGFAPVLDEAGRHLRAYLFDLAERGEGGRHPQPLRFFHAVSFLRVHEVKKHYAQLQSLEELAELAGGIHR